MMTKSKMNKSILKIKKKHSNQMKFKIDWESLVPKWNHKAYREEAKEEYILKMLEGKLEIEYL